MTKIASIIINVTQAATIKYPTSGILTNFYRPLSLLYSIFIQPKIYISLLEKEKGMKI